MMMMLTGIILAIEPVVDKSNKNPTKSPSLINVPPAVLHITLHNPSVFKKLDPQELEYILCVLMRFKKLSELHLLIVCWGECERQVYH